jgi:hypothetical protein
MPCIVEVKIVPKEAHEVEPMFRAIGKNDEEASAKAQILAQICGWNMENSVAFARALKTYRKSLALSPIIPLW